MDRVSLRDRIELLRSQYRDEGLDPDQIKRKIYRRLLAEGISFADISRSMSTIPATTTSVTAPTFIPTGCEVNENGFPIDPITLDVIPEELLISYATTSYTFSDATRSMKRCFNKDTLYEYLMRSGSDRHPITREEIPPSFLQELQEYGKSRRFTIETDTDTIEVEFFASIGEVILECLRTLNMSLLDSILRYDVLENNISLYKEDLDAPVNRSMKVHLKEFDMPLYRSDCLSSMFDFSKRRIGTNPYQELVSEIGENLMIAPVIRVPGGADYRVGSNSTVFDIILAVYELLGGLHQIQTYKVISEFQEPLIKKNLSGLVTSIIPGEEVYYVPYDDEGEKTLHLNIALQYAYNHSHRRLLLNVLGVEENHPTLVSLIDDERLNDAINAKLYTFDDLYQFLEEVLTRKIILEVDLRQLLRAYKTKGRLLTDLGTMVLTRGLESDNRQLFSFCVSILSLLGEKRVRNIFSTVPEYSSKGILSIPYRVARAFNANYRNYERAKNELVECIRDPRGTEEQLEIIVNLDDVSIFQKWYNPEWIGAIVYIFTDGKARRLIEYIIRNNIPPQSYFARLFSEASMDTIEMVLTGLDSEEFNTVVRTIENVHNYNGGINAILRDSRLTEETVNYLGTHGVHYIKFLNHPLFSDWIGADKYLTYDSVAYFVELIYKGLPERLVERGLERFRREGRFAELISTFEAYNGLVFDATRSREEVRDLIEG